MKKKKSKFLTFCLSFIPGAGEMYMGFMKMGVSLMGTFALIMTLAVLLNIGPVIILGVVVWFYSLFHANNLYSMRDEEFYELEDTYLFRLGIEELEMGELFRKFRKLIAWGLVVVGALLIWNNVMDMLVRTLPDEIGNFVRFISYRLPQIIVGVGIIMAGVFMIRGKKMELMGDREDGAGAQAASAKAANAQPAQTRTADTQPMETQVINVQPADTQGKAE